MKKRNLKSLKLSKISISNLHASKRGVVVSCSVVECQQSDTTITTIDAWSVFCPNTTLCDGNSLKGDCSLGYCGPTFYCA